MQESLNKTTVVNITYYCDRFAGNFNISSALLNIISTVFNTTRAVFNLNPNYNTDCMNKFTKAE